MLKGEKKFIKAQGAKKNYADSNERCNVHFSSLTELPRGMNECIKLEQV